MRRRIGLIGLLIAIILTGCGGEQARTLTVFAAISHAEALEAAAREFEAANPGVAVVISAGGSQQLAQQLAQGAPADIFISADAAQFAIVQAAGRLGAGEPLVRNQLTVIVPADNPAGLVDFAAIAKPGVALVVAAPEVPAGRYTREFLARAEAAGRGGFVAQVSANIVSEEQSVRAVAVKVALGEADAGIVYVTDSVGELPGPVVALTIPPELAGEALSVIGALSDAQEPGLAGEFVALLTGPTGQAIFARYGFAAP